MEVTSLIGGEVTFTCMATGIPLPTISWMGQDGVINASNETILDMITVYSQIVISDYRWRISPPTLVPLLINLIW